MVNAPDHLDEEIPPRMEEREAPLRAFEDALHHALQHGDNRVISRFPAGELETMLRETKRFYLDLDNSLLPAGTTSFDDYTLRMLRLIIDNGGEVTFLTGKPLSEVRKVVQSMPDDLQDKVAILYEKGAYRYTRANPEERLLTSEAVEREMEAVGTECFEEWAAVIAAEHEGVVLRRAGSGTHRSVLSIDLDRPDAQIPGADDPERMGAKLDPKNDADKIAAVVATLERLIRQKARPLDLHIINLGNANLEIEVVDIEKGAALARLEHDKSEEEHGRAMVMDDSGNGELMFRAGRFLRHVTTALVYHDTTPRGMLPLADIAVAGKAKGAYLLQKVAQAKGDTHDLTVVSNTPSLDRDSRTNAFINRMGAPVAIGGVVRDTRRALWIYPKQFGPDGRLEDFSDYPDDRLRGKFVPVGITKDEYDSQYNRFSNTDWWFWTHPDTFSELEASGPEHKARYLKVSRKLADTLAARIPNGDTRYVSTHDFQVLPVAAQFRQEHADKPNVRFHLFWHVPFPGLEHAKRLPEDELLERLRWFMSYDQIGFHTEEYRKNYLDLCAAFADRGIRPAKNVIVQPISIDVNDMRKHAIEVATAKDFRFGDPKMNDFFQLDIPEADRDELVMGPPERADPIKGGYDRLDALVELAKRDPRAFDGKRFLEMMVQSRLDSKPYADNYNGMQRKLDELNGVLGRKVMFDAGRLDDRREVAAAMHYASKALFTSRDDGFNMTIPEALVVWEQSRLVSPKIRRMIATNRTGFVLSLQEHGLLEPGKEAIPVMPSAARDADAFRDGIHALLTDRVPQPRYDVLGMYLSRYTLSKWIDANVRTHVRSSFTHGLEVTA